ncbi:neuroendocrine convertase 2-like [Mytilus edulis]|uniref:neuroendocrine convertase 2-like n=1 Tax=Mytilus edulis TaxID=6550 RepID=UPI0039F0434E
MISFRQHYTVGYNGYGTWTNATHTCLSNNRSLLKSRSTYSDHWLRYFMYEEDKGNEQCVSIRKKSTSMSLNYQFRLCSDHLPVLCKDENDSNLISTPVLRNQGSQFSACSTKSNFERTTWPTVTNMYDVERPVCHHHCLLYSMTVSLLIVLVILVHGLHSDQFEFNNKDDVTKPESSVNVEQNSESTDIIIKLQPDGTEEDIQDILSRYPKFKLSKQFKLFGDTYYKLSLDESKIPRQLVHGTVGLKEDDNDVLRMKNEKKVEFLEIDKKELIMPYADTSHSDPELTDMWHLNGVMKYPHHIQEAWALGYTGKGVTVGVVDSLIQTDHIDLTNMNVSSSYDYYNDDDDPNPTDSTMTHGTAVSGVIGATKGNDYCAVGVANNATLIAIGLLGAVGQIYLTDSQQAMAISHMSDTIDVYCNSYGPSGTYSSSSLGPLRLAAFENNAKYGRQGKGNIYVFAAGNGGSTATPNTKSTHLTIYTIGIQSVGYDSVARYGEIGSSILASAYGGSVFDRSFTSTSTNSGCIDGLRGTSFAAPLAVGIIALALEANNDLTWRDVQHLIVRTSKPYGFKDRFDIENKWQRNGAGFRVHHKMGFGLMNAEDMVKKAIKWKTVPEQLTWESEINISNMKERYKAKSKIDVSSDDCPIRHLEHVMATVSFSYSCCRGAVEVYLVSPSGTKVVLLPQRYSDALITYTTSGSFTWTYKVVHLWGENPLGKWKVFLKIDSMIASVELNGWYLTLYGTSSTPTKKG